MTAAHKFVLATKRVIIPLACQRCAPSMHTHLHGLGLAVIPSMHTHLHGMGTLVKEVTLVSSLVHLFLFFFFLAL